MQKINSQGDFVELKLEEGFLYALRSAGKPFNTSKHSAVSFSLYADLQPYMRLNRRYLLSQFP